MPRNPGTTVMETIVACSLLATTAVSLSLMSQRMRRGYQERALVQRAWVEVCNARQQIGTWNMEEIDCDKIQALPISDVLRNSCSAIEWAARVEETMEPLAGKRIFVGLQWTRAEQRSAPIGITFWHCSGSQSKASPDKDPTVEESS